MKAATLIRLCCVITTFVFSACGPKGADSIPAYEFETYTLFTWKVPRGDFCFKIMTRAESNEFIHRWFPKRNAKCGASELKTALAGLPKDSYVLWESWPPQGFDYPTDNIVDEIIAFAETKGIHVKVSPALR